jgi:large subunit ribosomal protein L24e
MVERRICSFCGNDVEPGTGQLYIKRDGTQSYFCRSKCRKNMVDLGRTPRLVKWTKVRRRGGRVEETVSSGAKIKITAERGKAPTKPAG